MEDIAASVRELNREFAEKCKRMQLQIAIDDGLSPNHKVIGMVLITYANHDTYHEKKILEMFPSMDLLKDDVNVHRETVKRAIKALVARAHFRKGKRKWKKKWHNVYVGVLKPKSTGRSAVAAEGAAVYGDGAQPSMGTGRTGAPLTIEGTIEVNTEVTYEVSYAQAQEVAPSAPSEGKEPSSADLLNLKEEKGWPGEPKASPEGSPTSRLPHSVIEMEARRRRDECSAQKLRRMRLDNLSRRLERFRPAPK